MNDSKRVILAIAISLAILVGWGMIFPPAPVQQTPVAENTTDSTNTSPVAENVPSASINTQVALPTTGKVLTIKNAYYTAKINTAGGFLEEFKLNDYKENIDKNSPDVNLISKKAAEKAPLGIILNGQPTWTNASWSGPTKNVTLEAEPVTLTFIGKLDEYTITRKLTFSPKTYFIDEVLLISSAKENISQVRVAFTLATNSVAPNESTYNPTKFAYYNIEEGYTEIKKAGKLEDGFSSTQYFDWAAIDSNYFGIAILPDAFEAEVKVRLQDEDIYRLAFERAADVYPNQNTQFAVQYYLGPLSDVQLKGGPANIEKIIDYGFFDILARPLVIALNEIYKVVNNYGVAIILLTMLIKLVFWPLSQKSYKSMNKMKQLQPMMLKIREKYKDDKEQINKETLALYKTYKVNPASGCLPILIQIPVFFGLYKALLGSLALRQAGFIDFLPFTDIVWLMDLSSKDPLYITPILMGFSMFLQQKMTPAPGDPLQAKIMMFLPVIFTIMFLNFPSGLVLYWLVNNLLAIFQQWLMMRKQ